MLFATPEMTLAEERALERIESVRRSLRHYLSEPRRWQGSVRRVLSARAIQGSNSIEGFHVSVEDAIAAVEGEEMQGGNLVDRQAVQGYRRSMTYVLGLAKDPHFAYTPELVRSLHFMMTEYDLGASPGLWRPKPIWVRNDVTGEIVYTAPDESDVPSLMTELMVNLQADEGSPVVIRAAMAHLNLVMIHPFRDGNGRMSRCLQTLVLAREQVLAQEFCSIEEYLGRNTQAYYDILAEVAGGQWSPHRDARPWVRFCLAAHYIQAESVLRRIRESEQLWVQLDERRAANGLPERTMAALIDAGIGLRVRNSSYRSQLRGWQEEISHQVATLDLRAMVKAGLLKQQGANRGAYYVATATVEEVRREVRRARVPIDASHLFNVNEPDEALPFS